MGKTKLTIGERRDTLHMLMHASANLKALAKDPDFECKALTKFVAKLIDDWCFTTVGEIDRPIVRAIGNDNQPPKPLSVHTNASVSDIAT